MRYLGNKENIVHEIEKLMRRCGLLDRKMVFFDAFCGTGAVSNKIWNYHDVILNDNLRCASTYSYGRLVGANCSFKYLGKDPFALLNNSEKRIEGFNYKNYSTACSTRMYFTPENASRIDYFRAQIEQWHHERKISNDEYIYLLACLIDAVSAVSNTAGVYGAFLKHWDKRALKEITINPISETGKLRFNNICLYNDKIEKIISEVECDILYLDPPYTQNQYGTQYHLLETLVLDDNPEISKITGSRYTAPMRSDWSYDVKAHILLDEVIAKTKAKHIMMSYSDDGIMSKEYITALMKIYGKEGTFTLTKIPFKKYNNHKTNTESEHFEYLFYVEKKEKQPVIQSPLNYIGSKAKLVDQIREKAASISTKEFLDVFGGGFNVGINFSCERLVYNDILAPVVSLMKMFKDAPTDKIIKELRQIIKRYSLAAHNKNAYELLRSEYNSNSNNPIMLYALVLYGFQQQIRFNNSSEFNNPSGSRYFNDSILAKLISFCRVIKKKKVEFLNRDFTSVLSEVQPGALVYLDPPYRNTVGSYNDGKRGGTGWDLKLENMLLHLIDTLDLKGVHFMFSYVINTKTTKNYNIINWLARKPYNIYQIESAQGRYNDRHEVLICNF